MEENKRISNSSIRIKEAMNMLNKTQADLVRETGLNKSTISRYLSGVCEPKQNAVAKLASSLNVSEMWIWGYDVPMGWEEVQNKNDALADIVLRLRTDEELLAVVQAVCNLDREKLLSLSTFLK